MTERPRQPTRSGRFADAPRPDREAGAEAVSMNYPATPSPTEPQDTGHAAARDEPRSSAWGLRDMIRSLPHRPAPTPTRAEASVPDAVSGVGDPSHEARPAGEWPSKAPAEAQAGDPAHVADRAESPTGGGGDLSSSVTAYFFGDQRDELMPIPPAVPLASDPGSVPAASSNRLMAVAPIEEGAHSPDQFEGPELTSPVPTPIITGAAEVPSGATGWVPSPAGPASEGSAWDEVRDAGATPETIAVGPIGPAGRAEDALDRVSTPATPRGRIGTDPIADRLGAVSPSGEGQPGADMGPTNTLLGQILDELRRYSQAPIASGRSVYPER